MAAATQNREPQRQPSELVPYTGSSGYTYYKGTGAMAQATGSGVIPVVQGAGASNAHFLGIVNDRVDLSEGLGSSQATLDIWKTGEVTLAANGTGASADIGLRAYFLDDQTVGTSIAPPCLFAGEIVGFPDTSTYRVRIDNAVNSDPQSQGVSWAVGQN